MIFITRTVMKNPTTKLITVLAALSVLLLAVAPADAARLGGGRSFGGRPSFSQPYQRSAPDAARPSTTPSAAPAVSAATQRNQAVRQSMANRGGLTSMLAGFAIGGLLGSLFFGGAFEHINFADLLIFGLLAFGAFKLLGARRREAAPVPVPATGYSRDQWADDNAGAGYPGKGVADAGSAGFDTDLLKSTARASHQTRWVAPAGFNAAAFIEDAKTAYSLMQKAWDDADLGTLRGLTTDKMFGELQEQLTARGGAHNVTELLDLQAELLDVHDTGSERQAAVLFSAVLREDPAQEPHPIKEVWHFMKPLSSRQATWFLDGIQQVEE